MRSCVFVFPISRGSTSEHCNFFILTAEGISIHVVIIRFLFAVSRHGVSIRSCILSNIMHDVSSKRSIINLHSSVEVYEHSKPMYKMTTSQPIG